MKYLLPFLLGIFLVFASCSGEGTTDPIIDDNEDPTGENPQEEEPELITYFTFEVSRNTADTDDWVIIHDENGNLLDYKPFESGDTLVFEISEDEVQPNSLTITLLEYDNSITANMLHNLNTYPEVPMGSHWKHTDDAEPVNENYRGAATGNFFVSLSNAVTPKYQVLSDRKGLISYQNGFFQQLEFNALIYDSSTIHYSIYDTNNDLKYFEIDGVSNDDQIFIDYTDFQSYDSYVEINLPVDVYPSHFLISEVTAFEEDRPMNMSGGVYFNYVISENNATSPYKLGYLNSYSKYHTFLFLSLSSHAYFYEKYGAKPEEISIPENPTISVTNESISNFQFETNVDFQMKDVLWEVKEGSNMVDLVQTSWHIISTPGFMGTIGEIPEEIQQTYPSIKINELKLSSTSLHLDFITYPELIQREFITPELKTFYQSNEIFSF